MKELIMNIDCFDICVSEHERGEDLYSAAINPNILSGVAAALARRREKTG